MDQLELTPETKDENEDYPNILNEKEYDIKYQNKDYKLKFRIDSDYFFFVLEDLSIKAYTYNNKFHFKDLANKLSLNTFEYPGLNDILTFLDKIFNMNKISIKNSIDNQARYILLT